MQEREKREQGFTLIELLIAIVVVGILTAVAIVGIAGLTDKGNGSACSSTIDASKAAAAVFYANSGGTYPSTFAQMTSPPAPAQPMLTLANGVKDNGTTLTGNGWTVTMTGGGQTGNTFSGTLTNGGGACEPSGGSA